MRKFFIFLLLMLILSFGINACSGGKSLRSPRDVVQALNMLMMKWNNEIGGVSSGDAQSVKLHRTKSLGMLTKSIVILFAEEKKASDFMDLWQLFNLGDLQVINETITGDKATVHVKLTVGKNPEPREGDFHLQRVEKRWVITRYEGNLRPSANNL